MLEGFNFRIIWEYMPFFMEGLRNTFLISIVSLFLALIAGITACAGRLSPCRTLARGLDDFSPAGDGPGQDTPEDVFRRLGGR